MPDKAISNDGELTGKLANVQPYLLIPFKLRKVVSS